MNQPDELFREAPEPDFNMLVYNSKYTLKTNALAQQLKLCLHQSFFEL